MKPTLILTRPTAANARFLALLSDAVKRAVEIIEAPLLMIRPTKTPFTTNGLNGVILTSINGVNHAPNGNGMRAFCVGKATTQAAQNAGWDAICIGQDADNLVTTLRAQQINGPLLHFSGTHRRGDIAHRLSADGIPTQVCEIYDQVLVPLSPLAKSALSRENPVILPLFSPRTARHLATVAKPVAPLHVVALSAAVADAMQGMQYETMHIAQTPDADAMLQTIELVVFQPRLG